MGSSLCCCRSFLRCPSLPLGSLSRWDLLPCFRVTLISSFGIWGICSSLFAQCHMCSSLLSFCVGKAGFCGSFALFGSPVPFATWSPFGTSQGFLFLGLARCRDSLPVVVSLWVVSPFPFPSDSFESTVPLATSSPFGDESGFPWGSVSFWFPVPYWYSALFRPRSVWMALRYSPGSSLDVFPRLMASVPVVGSPIVLLCVTTLSLL